MTIHDAMLLIGVGVAAGAGTMLGLYCGLQMAVPSIKALMKDDRS